MIIMEKKKMIVFMAIIKVPLLIYLVIILPLVPAIDIVEEKTVLGAHRGASLDFEENTLEAFEKAVNESEYEFIEFDIQYTQDKKIAVFHQNNIFRVAKKGVNVSDLDYADLDETFEFHIPEYSEVMSLIDDKKPVNIEIKSHGNLEDDKDLVDFVIADCRERGIVNQVMISAISEDVISYIEINYPEIKTGKIFWVVPSTFVGTEYLTNELYNSSEADYFLMHGYNIRNYELLKELKPEGKELAFWYFTDEMYLVGEEDNMHVFWDGE